VNAGAVMLPVRMDPTELELIALDRELKRAAESWRRWRRQLRRGTGYDDEPFLYARELLSRRVFQHLRELAPRDPLARPLSRWVYRLSEQRVNRALVAAIAFAWRSDPHPLDAPEQGEFTLAELLRRALSEPRRRSAWLEAMLGSAAELSERGVLLWQRRAEVAERAGLSSADEVELVCPEIGVFAENWLLRTRDLAESELPRRDLGPLLDVALGLDAAEGWPARVAPRTIQELFAGSRLLEGLDLDPGPLPDTIAPTSFLRALARVGAAFCDATAPRRQPFALAHDPYGLRRRELGALFTLLPLLPTFARTKLGLGRDRARRHVRALGRALLVESRVLALKVLLRPAALSGKNAMAEAVEAGIDRALGVGIKGVLPHAFLRLHADDSQRFAGALRAPARNAGLVSEHDEDWFQNPRAAEQLRAEAALTPAVELARAELEPCIEVSYRFIVEAIG
jgi:hypothetical protein